MTLLSREAVAPGDTWDLTSMYPDAEAWRTDFQRIEQNGDAVGQFVGTLGRSSAQVKAALELNLEMSRSLEKVYVYAHLLSDQDTANTEYLGYLDQATNLYSRIGELWSFFTPEILALSDEKISSFLEDPSLAPYRRMLLEIVRYKPHTLSKDEEQLLAAGAEVFGSSEKVFSQLNNADLTFGTIPVEGEEKTLSHGTYTLFLKHADRSVRKRAFEQYYGVFEAHKHTLAATLGSSIKRDIYLARVKRYPSALERSLFGDDVPLAVYDNLIETVAKNIAPLHRYYELRKRLLRLDEMRIFDTYVPLVSDVTVQHTFDEAARLVTDSLHPLGEEYVSVLREGMGSGRWVDRYENKGKRSGAYSSGCYDSVPYILMNYKADSLNDVYTLAHEAGHSMHSFFSCREQPFQDHSYTIFVAEVASTFNEQLLSRHLQTLYTDNRRMLAYLINQQIDDIKATLYRQTMFAEFEKIIHERAEKHEALTLDTFRGVYRKLLEKYFGKAAVITDTDELECFRIPHFYSAFYVYKYATGLSAAIALAERVTKGGKKERNEYLGFLRSGCSKYPLELLRNAGVDMATPAPIESALKRFAALVDELENTLAKI